MKHRITAICLVGVIIFSCITINCNAGELCLSAKSAVLMEADSKDILFEKNSAEILPMASTTKIMTALVVLERCRIDQSFTVDERAVGTEGTSAYLQTGDVMTVEAALYALLLQSANDAANALALEVSKSIDDFAALMNEKARALGLENTCFKNPSGLPEDGHHTTAAELAYLAAVCLENETFYKIVSTKSATVRIGGKDRTFTNHNKLLSLYDGAVGVKTGFTKESGRCLVGAAERNGVRLITVTLSASSDWSDHTRLFDLGFETYKSYMLCTSEDFIVSLKSSDGRVLLSPREAVRITLKKGAKISTRIEATSTVFPSTQKDLPIAFAVFYSNEKELCRVPLYLRTSYA